MNQRRPRTLVRQSPEPNPKAGRTARRLNVSIRGKFLLFGVLLHLTAAHAEVATLTAPAENCYEVEKAARTATGWVLALARGGGFAHITAADIRFEPREGPMLVCRAMNTPRLRLYVPTLRSEAGITLAHDGYEKWMQPPHPTLSCCNKQDCEPVEARYIEERGVYQARIEGEWRDIPPAIILDPKKPENATPDGSYHACWNRLSKVLLCFREAEPKI
jgi:hypothetical protein